jgi:hypothetical protein
MTAIPLSQAAIRYASQIQGFRCCNTMRNLHQLISEEYVAREQRGDAFISRRARRPNWSDEKRRDLRSIVTSIVWHRRRPNPGDVACAAIFRESPKGLVYHGDPSDDEALTLQRSPRRDLAPESRLPFPGRLAAKRSLAPTCMEVRIAFVRIRGGVGGCRGASRSTVLRAIPHCLA